MRAIPGFLGLLVVAAVVLGQPVAYGQGGYNPGYPGASPWWGLFAPKGAAGPLGNYNSYVRPQIELQNALQRQSLGLEQQGVAIQQNTAQIRSTGKQLDEMEHRVFAPTGIGATYMNYSHYYGFPTAGGTVPGRSPMPARSSSIRR